MSGNECRIKSLARELAPGDLARFMRHYLAEYQQPIIIKVNMNTICESLCYLMIPRCEQTISIVKAAGNRYADCQTYTSEAFWQASCSTYYIHGHAGK